MTRRSTLPCRIALLSVLSAVPLIGCNRSVHERAPAANPAVSETEVPARPAPDPTNARLERVRMSIEQGLDVNQSDEFGRTPLMMAAFEGLADVAALLLEHGAEVDRRDGNGRTALMYASSGPSHETVDLLLRSGAGVDAADEVERWTALMFASAEGQVRVVETLLRHGADPGVTDQDGDAAVEHARERGQARVVSLFESLPTGK